MSTINLTVIRDAPFLPSSPPGYLCSPNIFSAHPPHRGAWSQARKLLRRKYIFFVFLDPVDAMKSSVHDIKRDTTKKGAFTFRVAPKDRYKNPIRVATEDNKKYAKISVQYSSYEQPKSLKFLQCSTIMSTEADGDFYVLRCEGARKEQIFFYPSINNVPLGGQEKYEARTTLCPGRNSCREGNLILFY